MTDNLPNSVLFDLDGTLVNPRVGITTSIRFAMAELQRPLPPETNIDWCIGPPLQHLFTKLLGSDDPDLIAQAITAFRQRYGNIGLFEAELYPGILECLNNLKATELTLYIATSKAAVYARRIVDHFGLDDYFVKVYGSELDGRLSDKSDLIRHILIQEKLNSAQVMMIGDRKHDIVGAQNNGVKVTAVTYGFGSLDELLPANADYYINKPAQIIPLLNRTTI